MQNSIFNDSLLGEFISNVSFAYLLVAMLLTISIISSIIIRFVLRGKFIRRKFEFYKNAYPNAFAEFSRRTHIYPRKNYDELKKEEIKKILSYQPNEWENTEKQEKERIEQEKLVRTKYNEIKNRYPDGLNCWKQTYPNATEVEIVLNYSNIIILNEKHLTEKWKQEQCSFAKLCHTKIATMPHCSYYQYNIDFPKNCNVKTINAQYYIWQFCFSEFCSEEDLDYTYFQQIKDNYEYIKSGDYYYDYANRFVEPKSYISKEIRRFAKSLNTPIEIILTEDNLGENPQMYILHSDLNIVGCKTIRWGDIDNINSKYIIIIDTITTNEQLKRNCELICQKHQKLRPCITYISLMKELSREEMQGLINSKKIKNERQESKDKSHNFTTDTNIENIVSPTVLDFKNNKTKDINSDLEIHKVDYPIPIQFLQKNEDWEYAVVKFPKEENIVFPYRRHSIARKGYMDLNFQSYLQNVLGNQLLVISDCSILPAENYRPYEPDIAIIDLNKPSIRIDIEIDEPYSAISNQPIHFIGCGDDFRDANLNNLGWIVIRFTEYQVVSNMQGCAAVIAQILNAINPNLTICTSLLSHSLPAPVKRWSNVEATIMASEKIREKYLNHKFGIKDVEPITLSDIKQNDIEQKYATLIKPLVINKNKPLKITNPNIQFHRDENIQFLPLEHIYLYKGKERLIPVSSIISYFFTEFDAFKHSERIARQRGVPQGQILEEWDEKNTRSKEIGKFVHKQIAHNYNGLKYQNKYHFLYTGKYVKTDEYIDLQREYEQFRLFLDHHIFTPFETEWSIYDENLKIAGTIDMIHKKGTLYDIYDWKYSHRIADSTGSPILFNSYGEKGLRGLENVQDTEYWKSCLRQNLYKCILEKNYKFRIDKMYLILFSDKYPSYLKFEVPCMDNEIKIIWDFCEKSNIVQLF